LRPVPWRNGQGVTRDIMTVTGPDGDMRWQVGIADLERDSPFSDFSGYDRVFTPIAGEVALAFDGGAFEACPVLVPFAFAGERATLCRVAAPGRAFNVVVDRRYHRGEAAVLRLSPGDAVPSRPAVMILHVLSGRLQCESGPIGPGDTAIDDGPATALEPSVAICASID